VTVQEHIDKCWGALDKEYTSFKGHHRDLQKYLQPRRGRFQVDESGNAGSKKHNYILNGTGIYAQRALSSGMMAGLTSPARPWLKLITRDPEMREYRPAKVWLQMVTRLMQTVFSRCNLYDSLPMVYTEMGIFGQGPMSVLNDFDTVITTKQYTVGSYRIACDQKGVVDTFYRKVPMTVKQLVEMFGLRKDNLRNEGVSQRVNDLWDKGDYYQMIPVIHAVEPRMERKFDGLGNQNMPWMSAYVEEGEDDTILRHSGFDRMRVLCPRWESLDDSAYASACPGMDTLADVQQLQKEELMKNEGLSKQNAPPLKAPNALQSSQVNLLAGQVTFFDQDPDMRFEPVYQVQPDISGLVLDLQRFEDRIRTGLYADMFLMLYSLHNNPAMTATEVQERHSEKLLLLGPVLERINNQGLDPLVDITFERMLQTGLIPPPPPEMFGQELGVEYISVLAQAQRAIGVGNVERFFGFIGGLMQMDPTARHYVDTGATINRYGEMIGAPADMIRDKREVEQLIAAEQQQMAQQQALDVASVGADAMKKASETKMAEGDSALDRVVQGVGAP